MNKIVVENTKIAHLVKSAQLMVELPDKHLKSTSYKELVEMLIETAT